MIAREIAQKVMEISNTFPVLLITGPRQVGKTTLLKSLMDQNRAYVTLDDPSARLLAKQDPKFFLEKYAPPVLIDEIQYAPELFTYIKIDVDANKKYGNYWITGSQMFHLMKNVSESLAGRVGILNMQGVSYNERTGNIKTTRFRPDIASRNPLKSTISSQELFELIFRGSLPEVVANSSINKDSYYESYIRTYIERDVRDLINVQNELDFYTFLVATAARSGEVLNYSTLAQDVGVSSNTIKSWISILQTSGIIYLLHPYHSNLLKRVIKMPKLYFMDTGLCTYLTEWPNAKVLAAGSMAGNIFETYVISELIKNYYHKGIRPPIYYYRDTEKREIDLIIYEEHTLFPVEIKKGKTLRKDWIKHFKALEKFKISTSPAQPTLGMGGVICLCDETFPIDRNNYIFPVQVL